jgi:hypothetical protein
MCNFGCAGNCNEIAEYEVKQIDVILGEGVSIKISTYIDNILYRCGQVES